MSSRVKQLKKQLAVAAISVVMACVALGSATYAWFAFNNTVSARTATVTAMANGMTLQIVAGTTPDHGKDNDTVAFDSTTAHEISPSSTDDAKTWFVPASWGDGALVTSYQIANGLDAATGQYTVGDKTFYAYNVSTYTVYTVRDTGIADVYLDGSADEGAISVTSNGQPLNDKVARSMRIGISTVDAHGNETLKVVYAPSEPAGMGNDAYSRQNGIAGWTAVADASSTKAATYKHLFGTTYVDQNGGNWAATKNGKNFDAPVDNPAALATHVDYNGVILKVYIWLEGTDADCVNTAASAVDEGLSYDVTLRMVGTNSQ